MEPRCSTWLRNVPRRIATCFSSLRPEKVAHAVGSVGAAAQVTRTSTSDNVGECKLERKAALQPAALPRLTIEASLCVCVCVCVCVAS